MSKRVIFKSVFERVSKMGPDASEVHAMGTTRGKKKLRLMRAPKQYDGK